MIEPGGIYRAVSMAPRTRAALVLVTGVDDDTQSLTVTLLSPDVEFGTNADLTLKGEEMGLAYDLLAESDIFGYMWFAQIDANRELGRVTTEVLSALEALRQEDAVELPIAGPPVIQRGDPRWTFKLQELERLQALTADCTRELVDGELTASIDPNALRAPSTEEDVAAFEEFVVEVVSGVKRGDTKIPGWLIDIALNDERREAYRKVGLITSLRLLWKYAEADSPRANATATSTSLEDLKSQQVELAASEGRSNLRLIGRSIDVRGPIEARPARARDGRLIQLSHVSAGARFATHRKAAA